jgi:hypothetical protein
MCLHERVYEILEKSQALMARLFHSNVRIPQVRNLNGWKKLRGRLPIGKTPALFPPEQGSE